MSASAKVKVEVDASVSGSPDLGSAVHSFIKAFSVAFANGAGAGQINQIFADERTLAAGANEDLDLAGVLQNALGQSVAFTSIKGILITADAANGDNIEVGGAAANAFVGWVGDASDQVVVQPDGAFALFTPGASGYAVTATTADLLRITNADGAAAATYTIVLLGTE